MGMQLLRCHLFAFFCKQNGFIKKLVSNSSVFSPSELSSIRSPRRLDRFQQALLRLPLVHSLAQSTLPQQGSLSALNAPCFFFFSSLPWALAQNWSSPTSVLPLSLSERLFLCRVLPNTAKVLPSLAAEVLKVLTGLGAVREGPCPFLCPGRVGCCLHPPRGAKCFLLCPSATKQLDFFFPVEN